MRILILILLCTLCGCSNATKKTHISLPQTVELDFKVPLSSTQGEGLVQDTQPVTITIEQVVTLSGLDVATRTSQEPVTDTDADVPLALGMPGATPSASVGDLQQEGIESKNITPAPVIVTPVVTPTVETPATDETSDEEDPSEEDLMTYSYETHSMKDLAGNNKRYAWMSHKGAYYGKNIIAKYSDGESWLIEEGAYAQGKDGNGDNHNQMFWMSGNPDQQEDTHMGCEGGCASIFSKPGTAPESVTIYYKKVEE